MSDIVQIVQYHILKVIHVCFIGILWIFHGCLKIYIFQVCFPMDSTSCWHAIFLIAGLNCNHMTRIAAITHQLQVIFRCTKIPNW